MKLNKPQQAYVNLWLHISGEKVSYNKACINLEKYFQSNEEKEYK